MIVSCDNCGGEGRLYDSRYGGNDPDVWDAGECKACAGDGQIELACSCGKDATSRNDDGEPMCGGCRAEWDREMDSGYALPPVVPYVSIRNSTLNHRIWLQMEAAYHAAESRKWRGMEYPVTASTHQRMAAELHAEMQLRLDQLIGV